MRNLILLFLLISILPDIVSQNLKTITVKTPSPVKTKEVFQVIKDNPKIKNGNYKKYRSKKIIEVGFYKNNNKDSIWNIYNQNGKVIATGNYKENKKIGVWKFYSKTGILVQEYNFSIDSLTYFNVTEEKKWNSSPSIYPDTASDQMPIFIGGSGYMHTLIENNLIYPTAAYKKLKKGNVYISFTVEKDGSVTNVKSLKLAGYGFDEEGIRLVESFIEKWIPGKQKGKLVRVQYNLPIKFSIK